MSKHAKRPAPTLTPFDAEPRIQDHDVIVHYATYDYDLRQIVTRCNLEPAEAEAAITTRQERLVSCPDCVAAYVPAHSH